MFSKKTIKTFLIEDFSFATGDNDTGGAPEFSKKYEMALMVYSWAWGKLILKKNLKHLNGSLAFI